MQNSLFDASMRKLNFRIEIEILPQCAKTFYLQLELFDLDEAFSSEKARLAQITNKCTDEDIDYYVREAADILGVTQNVPNLGGVNTTKRILEYILAHIVEFKKLNQETLHQYQME